jgi:holo-[acyl-carrier protein] synthase
VFSAEEKKQILRKSSVHRNESMAGRFAAKEAIIKALGKFFDRGVYFSDIGIVTDASGQPSVALAEKLTERMHGARILISIAHDGEYAIAQALIVSEDQHEK